MPGTAGAKVNTPDVLSYANEPPPLADAVVVLKLPNDIRLDKSAGAKVNTPVPLSYAKAPPPLDELVLLLIAALLLAFVKYKFVPSAKLLVVLLLRSKFVPVCKFTLASALVFVKYKFVPSAKSDVLAGIL